MSPLKRLKDCSNLHDFAHVLGYEPKALSYILYKIPENQKYKTFTIPKKNGTERTIKAPHNRLKKVQIRLSKLLHDCTEELLPDNQRLKKPKDKNEQTSHRANKAISHGFEKGLSIASNAALHRQKRYVLNLDLEDFFPSINFGRVRGYFIKNKNFMLSPKVATIIAQIACHDNTLPQGSPCSPILSNLIGEILDIRLLKLAKKYKCTYSRYADDITLSTNQKIFPKELAFKKHKKKTDWIIAEELKNCILHSGFNINDTKTRMQYDDARQVVTGLVVNRVVNTKSEYYRYARVMCHSLFMTGSFQMPLMKEKQKTIHLNYFSKMFIALKKLFLYKLKNKNDLVNSVEIETEQEDIKSPSLKQLEGILSHIYYVKNYKNKYAQDGYRKTRHDGYIKPRQDTDTPQYPPLNRCNQYTDESHKVSIDGIKNLYAKFLFFKHFYFLDKPLIVCEGKTDNIYFQCALKNLVADYPSLIQKNDKKTKNNDPDFVFHINFLNKTETLQEMLKMAEGASGLIYIMLGYERWMKKYKCAGKKHPVIMIVDNDKAGNDLIKAACGKYSKNSNDPFIHVIENLYLLQLPKVQDMDTEPENYFDKTVLNKTFNSKTFHPKENGFDEKKHYSKSLFAEKIIKPYWKTIDFNRFRQVLDLIVAINADYKIKI